MEKKDILWGLDGASTNEEVLEKAFSLIGTIRFMPAATVAKGHPECRILDFNRLSDGNLYFMTSKGKPTYKQLMAQPELVLNTLIDERYSLRLNAKVAVEHSQAIWDEFFGLNPGTMEMYRNNPGIMVIFKLVAGEGELFHLYANERIRRVRFSFGEGERVRPMTYKILDACVGCGVCAKNCVADAIRMENGRYRIFEADCDDCGICYSKCPNQEVGMACLLLKD